MKEMEFILVTLIVLITFWNVSDGSKIPIIVDTDIGNWKDDPGALSMLHRFADINLIDIRAIMANSRYEGIVSVIESINLYFNRTSIQIGITKDSNASDYLISLWPKYVYDHYDHPMFQINDQAEDAVPLYRRMLATSRNNSVIILSIGFFYNLARLIESGPDQYSHLNGYELIEQKVYRLVAMAGEFPTGHEWNIAIGAEAAKLALKRWPTSVVFVGFESGDHFDCGNDPKYWTPSTINSPIRKAWEIIHDDYIGCFDQIAAFIAVFGVDPFYTQIYGSIEILSNGTNYWVNSMNNTPTKMSYVRQKIDDITIVDIINFWMEN
ncbi:hypothetical protein SSS_04502 [Sarcoptes scabiei]|uniref:IU_nuc_hydro domain-containing protein n=1 Tax=Sarcoptes scabiei TaxID=52283 RepID=A0A132AAA3_SARSC|nr:hypothetical protein SSS_04502 [Sarcoptes scabiei]KPM07894.1 hypothetical protein QR98_0064050 [Sarcoptes scabiei]